MILAAMRGSTSVQSAIMLAESSLARPRDRPRARAYILVYLGYLLALAGDAVAARETVKTARSELETLGEVVGLRTSALQFMGDMESVAGDWARKKEVFEEGLE